MANDFLNAAGGFGEAFFKTLQSERERQDRLNQQQQEFNQKTREMNLINAWKQKMFDYGVQTDKLKAQGEYTKVDPNTAPENIKPNIFGGKDYPNLLDPNSFYVPNNEIPEQPKPEKTPKPEVILLGEGSVGGRKGIKYGYIGEDGKEVITKFDEFNKGTIVKIDMPKPEKWKEFGNLITEAKENKFTDKDGNEVEKSQQEINKAWNKAKNNFYSNMNPNAYVFYKAKFKDTGKEKVDNATYLQTIKEGLANDQLTPDDAQDLIDASAYRSDLFGVK